MGYLRIHNEFDPLNRKKNHKTLGGFVLAISDRVYEFETYQYEDADLWWETFKKLLDYKQAILNQRSINFNYKYFRIWDDTSSMSRIKKFRLNNEDFDQDGFVLPLNFRNDSTFPIHK